MDIRTLKKGKGMHLRGKGFSRSERGASLVELAFILPILVVLVYGVVEFGRLIHARLVVTNVSREGGSLASRDIRVGQQLITMLQSSASPFDLKNAYGRIWITRIKAGLSESQPEPYILSRDQGGGLGVKQLPSPALWAPLRGGCRQRSTTTCISTRRTTHRTSRRVTVVEVFYLYRPITPLPSFIQDTRAAERGDADREQGRFLRG